MLLFALMLLVFIVIYIIASKKNKSAFIFFSLVSCIIMMVFLGTIYAAKSTSYIPTSKYDSEIYFFLYRLKISIPKLYFSYNVLFVAYMLISLFFAATLLKLKPGKIFLLLIPILLYSGWISNSVTTWIYIKSHESANAMLKLERLRRSMNTACTVLISVYTFFPFCCLLLRIRQAKIFTNRRQYILMSIISLILSVFFLYMFVFGVFREVFFTNVTISKLAVGAAPLSVRKVILFTLFFSIVVSLALSAYYNPASFSFLNRHAEIKLSRMLQSNLHLIMHTYKNVLISLGQQFQLAESSIDRPEQCLSYIKVGSHITEDSISDMNMLLGYLKAPGSSSIISLTKCIRRAIDKVGARVFFESKEDILLCANSYHITEVFVNLLLNALAANNKGDQFQIRINVLTEENTCMIEIYDNGEGIEKKNLKKIFEPFFTTKKKTKGNGLGLRYVKTIIRIYRGEIRVKSKLNEYTLFQIALPYLKGDKINENL